MILTHQALADLEQAVDKILLKASYRQDTKDYKIQQEIMELSEYGLTLEEILELMRLSNSPQVQEATAQGRIEGIKKVKRALFHNALQGDTHAADYYLRYMDVDLSF